jgi:lysophospholipase L1-like esterase
MLQIGINDLLSGRDTADILRDYQNMVERLKSKNVKSVCTLPFYTRYRPEVESEQTGMNLRLKEMIEKQGFICLDLNPRFAPDNKMLLKYSSDGVHLNAEGYLIWAGLIRQVTKD